MAFAGKTDIKGHIIPKKRNFRHKALIIREKIIDMYRNRGITGRTLALVAAMTVGEKGLLEQDQKEIFIKAGVMHIMAVSGLHAVVLSMFVFNFLFFLKRRFNILRIIVALLILWAFAFVTGLTPSVMRATLMFSFIQAGNLLKRPANSMNSVLASAVVLIIIRPSVIFDAGFLLSYSAVIFIIAFYRDLYSKLNFKSFFADKIWQSTAITIVAQAGTLSLSIMLFNRFPVYFLVTNLIIVPLSSLVIIAGSMVPVLYPVAFLSGLVAQVLNYLTVLTEYLTEKAATLPGSTIDMIGFTLPEFFILSLIIAITFHAVLRKEFRPVNLLLILILLYAGVSMIGILNTGRSNELIVYNIPGATVAGIRTGRSMYLYTSVNEVPSEVIRHCSTKGIKIKKIQSVQNPVCLKAGGRRILISNKIDMNILSSTQPGIIILSGTRPLIQDISAMENMPEIIITSSEISSGFRLPAVITAQLKQPVHNIRKSGAYLSGLGQK
jgi:competence protein ComEC